jgi:peptidoglycan/xylan/chitin deacetylase (PgdA/CDA1 family)
MKAFSLMYHDVVAPGRFGDSGISGADADLYKLEQPDFRRHLDAVARVAKDRVGIVTDAIDGQSVFLTFDDGGASAPWIARELEQRGWRGHFFITTDWIGKPGFVTAAELRAMHAAGHVIGSHSASHPLRLSGLERSAIAREWRESVQALGESLGAAVTVGSVPGGFYSREVAETAAESGIRTLFTSEPTEQAWQVGDCVMLGRYFVQSGMTPEVAASFAGGPAGPRRKQRTMWKLKKIAKSLGGDLYVRARVAYIGKRNAP